MTDQPSPSEPTRLVRSREQRVLGGVAGGIAAHLGIDAIVVRLAFVAFAFVGGAGVLAYLVAWVLVPDAETPDADASARLRAAMRVALTLTAAVSVAELALVAGFAIAGFGGTLAAALVVLVAGLAVAAAAFAPATRRAARVAALPAAALALGVAAPVAAGIDLGGGLGNRTVRPTQADAVPHHVRAGAGQLVVDLRAARLPRGGEHRLRVDLGVGDLRVMVPPRGVCVADELTVGAGAVSWFGRQEAGTDVRHADHPARGMTRLVLVGHVGAGRLLVDSRDVDPESPGDAEDRLTPIAAPPCG